MGVEVVAPEVVKMPVQNGFNGPEHEKENETLVDPIKFGSNGDGELVKAKVDVAPETTVPTNVADEWPAPRQTHSFYFIRCRQYEDPKLKTRIDQAEKEFTRRKDRRFQLIEELRAKRGDRGEVISKLKELTGESRQYKEAADGKRKEMGPLQEALGQMRTNNNGGRGAVICSSEEELNDVIYSLKYRMQHESIPLSEEKQILREIKQLEGTRKEVIANAARRTQIQISLGPKEDLQDKVKLISVDLNGVKKEQQAISAKIKTLDEAKKAIDKEIEALEAELEVATEKRDEAFQTFQGLRKQREDGNTSFYQHRQLLNTTVRDLCYKKDVQTLEELAHTEVDKFMSSWCSSKAFRDDYEKRLLGSLDSRQLSRDGRMRNPDEKPLVVVEAPPKPLETEALAKPIVKRAKEDAKPVTPQETAKNEVNGASADSRTSSKHNDIENEEIYGLETTKGNAKKEVDAPKSKETIRQEEMAKAKQAMERKKKLAEKAAAKAAIRAQKEAEKKQQALERKLKKKTAGSAPAADTNLEESAEVESESAEPEKVEETVEAPVSAKAKAFKDNKTRYRSRAKGPEALPKVILKRKKSTNYWVWAAPAVLVVLVLVALGYHYLL